ncbi:MAG: GGDEF domain-containing protein [Moraxellaceae bacterium]|jgi:diguanylate cyclase (GGDEF)-like protein|nr:GGDEF domain-containing protein [Moraxellaceae bacterium]MBP9045626.1 GGDEF domain-containing protein [Moraxellaceae bacterium]MBP9730729.1 GGDEF domain-containing protein [Moraxellaceae bacterium]HQV41224.1 diguanylate cyclase [Moraxellaceae bacterium]HQX90115.1 diguanylate cyclase [Moraxellaceae bacterium]
MTALDSSTLDTKIQKIQGLLEQNSPFLRFPEPLEHGFHVNIQRRAIDLLNYSWWLVLGFYIFLGLVTWTQLQVFSAPPYQEQSDTVWRWIFLSEGVVIAILLGLPRLPRLDRWYHHYVAVISISSVAIITIGASAFADPFLNQYSSYVVILIIVIIYGIGGLRLVPAMVACMSAAVLSYLVIRHFDLWYNWGYFSQYVGLTNAVGILLGYLLERRDRTMFLQAELLVLEKYKLDQLSQEFNRLSREDALTGLANRRHFNEMLLQEWERGRRDRKPVALIFIDVDHFKPFNDTHGHVEGDRALSLVGVGLKMVLRRAGDIAARYGGEEFVLLLPGTSLEGAKEVALQVARSIQALHIPHQASNVSDYVTVSMGVAAMVPVGEMGSAELLAKADEAVYAAKEAGRNCIISVQSDGLIDPIPLRLI